MSMTGGTSKNHSTGRTPQAAPVVAEIARTVGDVAIFPAGFPLRGATFESRNSHLVARAPGRPDVIVPRFFNGGGQTTLATADGAEISRHMAILLLNLSDRMGRVFDELSMPGTGER